MRLVLPLVIVSAVLALVPGCSPGLTLGPAAAELQKDVHRLEFSEVFKNPLKKLKILQRPDRDLPCAKGKFERVFRATADKERVAGDPVDNHLDHAQRIIENVLSQDTGYRVLYDFSQYDDEEGRVVQAVKEDLGITVTVVVAPEPPTWRLRAKTACLPR